MEEVLLKQLVRQLKIVNVWLTFFGSLFIITLVAAGILIFTLVREVRQTEQKLTETQQQIKENLDVQKQICSTNGVSDILKRTTDYCN